MPFLTAGDAAACGPDRTLRDSAGNIYSDIQLFTGFESCPLHLHLRPAFYLPRPAVSSFLPNSRSFRVAVTHGSQEGLSPAASQIFAPSVDESSMEFGNFRLTLVVTCLSLSFSSPLQYRARTNLPSLVRSTSQLFFLHS